MDRPTARKGTPAPARTLRSEVAPQRSKTPALVHVPLQGIGCAELPHSDLADPNHFVVWTRFYAHLGPQHDLWGNGGWRSAARTLFAPTLRAVAEGDVEALLTLLVDVPQALAFDECREALVKIIIERKHAHLSILAQLLALRRPLKPNAKQKQAAALVDEQVNQAKYRLAIGKASASQPPSFHAVVTALAGGQPTLSARARKLEENAQGDRRRALTMYQVDALYGVCPHHPKFANLVLAAPRRSRGSDPEDFPHIVSPGSAPSRHGRRVVPRPGLHMIYGIDG